jgi:hypothetical protein
MWRHTFVSSAESTWGLFYSGNHFGSISATVNDWSQKLRREQGATPDRSR